MFGLFKNKQKNTEEVKPPNGWSEEMKDELSKSPTIRLYEYIGPRGEEKRTEIKTRCIKIKLHKYVTEIRSQMIGIIRKRCFSVRLIAKNKAL